MLEKLIAELRKRLQEISAELRKLVVEEGSRSLSDEETTRYKSLEEDFRSTDEKLTRAESQLARENGLTLDEQRAGKAARVVVTRADGEDEEGNSKRWKTLGEHLVSVARADSGLGVDQRLIEDRAATGASAGVEADGGYLIGKDFSTVLWKRAFEESKLASKCFEVPISSNSDGLEMNALEDSSRADGSRYGGVRVYRIKEADTVTPSQVKFRRIKLDLEELMGLAYATERLLQDAPALETIITEAFISEMSFKLDDEILRGTGVGEPLGILNAPGTLSIAKEGSQPADTVVRENIVNMRTSANRFSQSEWFLNEELLPQLEQMYVEVGPTGAKTSYPVFTPAGGSSVRPFDTLYGRPVNYIEHASALGDLGDIMLLDLKEYLIIRKGGINSAASIHVRFIYNERCFRFTARSNGMPLWNKPVTRYKGTKKKSPYVVLAERS
jgi:HK97 family phage major capsid protein